MTALMSYAAAPNSSFALLTAAAPGTAFIGEPVYIVAKLLSSVGRQVYVASNVVFNLTGAAVC